jgi:hypothetical protein
MPLAFHTSMIIVDEKYDDILIGSPMLFIRGAAHVKSIRVERVVYREPFAFCMRHCACKKYKSRMVHRSEAPCFLYAVLHV